MKYFFFKKSTIIIINIEYMINEYSLPIFFYAIHMLNNVI